MKDYREMAERVLARRDEYQKRKEKNTRRGLLSAGICGILAVFCIGVFYDAPALEAGSSEFKENSQYMVEPESANQAYQENSCIAGMLTADSQEPVSDVYIPAFVAYNGCLYGSAGETTFSWELTHPNGLQLRETYFWDVYTTPADPNLIAVKTAGGYTAYKKLFDVTFTLDDTKYGICYTPFMGDNFTTGDLLRDFGEYQVYSAVDAGKILEHTYIVNIGTLLQNELPDLFDARENWGEFYWLAKPLPVEHAADPNGLYIEAPSLSAMGAYDSAYGGCYLDGSEFHIVLVEDTPEIRRGICKIIGVTEENTTFVPGRYSLTYLTQLQEKISNGMINRTLPFVLSSGVYENENCIRVTVAPGTSEEILKDLFVLDTLGDAILVEEGEIAVCY